MKTEKQKRLERREQLRLAEREGNIEFLDRELAKARLTPEQAQRAGSTGTPIGKWPDEDFGDWRFA